MSLKSIFLSILSLVLFVGVIFAVVFLFKFQIVLGFLGILLFAIPIKVNRVAVESADGVFDKLLAKYLIPVLALIGVVFIILYFAL